MERIPEEYFHERLPERRVKILRDFFARIDKNFAKGVDDPLLRALQRQTGVTFELADFEKNESGIVALLTDVIGLDYDDASAIANDVAGQKNARSGFEKALDEGPDATLEFINRMQKETTRKRKRR